MTTFITSFLAQLYASLPFFILVGLGYFLVRVRKWPSSFTDGLTRFLFNIAIPVMLFGIMARFYTQPAVDIRLLFAYFGGSFIVYLIARVIGQKGLKLTGSEASVFGVGGIFSNNVMLGIPLVSLFIGPEALPVSALIISFNALLLWSLVSISVEWAEHGSPSLRGVFQTFRGVLKNPIVMGVASGLIVSSFHRPLPSFMQETLSMVTDMTAPLSLFALGLGLAEYKIADRFKTSLGICFIKLFLHPLIIWGCAILLDLPPLETKAIVLLGSMAMGMNVYLMARRFRVIEGPVASSLVISTVASAITTPLILLLIP
ncbi:AEC family transporter [Ignatzschineria sp. RMDPL8A]|uniref:AEC family transporter n=1 Tax=Ignatzschineria sp. RMDPL8A TaxID=2999236 RepID=UPI00244665FC|nr:AEC family transporter [Ignatzschineria sp. RMDPL8A]MDG9729104.1 AEC family transporter [Ignatzschineria sp. RMDPL8A]